MPPQSPAADHKSNPNPPTSTSSATPPGGPDWWLMMKAFLRHGRKIASFAPSSRFMARKVVDGIDWDSTRCVVELGAGTGPITAQLVRRLRPQTRAIVIELDPVLCGRLKARFQGIANLEVIQGDATQFDKLLAERGIPQVDHVLSGLPLPSFPEELRHAVLETSARTLASGGTFRQLTVMPLIYYKMYCRYFDDVRFRFVPWNLPPGGVYVCRGFRPKSA
jgi:phospholipid N-methyltransferase